MNKKVLDIIYGTVFFLFSIFCFLYLIPNQVRVNASYAVGPDTFPKITAAIFGLAGFFIAFNKFIGLADKSVLWSKKSYTIDWKSILKQVGFVAIFIAYILLMPFIGFIIASSIFVFCMFYYFGSRTLIKNIILSVIFPLIVYFLFSRLFKVNLERGFLPF